MSNFQEFRKKVRFSWIGKILLHPGITLTGLILLIVQVFFGTLYQADYGLYQAQEKFFSYGLLLFGWLPVPGVQIILWVLSIQLLSSIILVLPLKLRSAGLWVLHLGLIVLMLGGFLTDLFAVESHLTLAEGQTGYYSQSYHNWELAIWESKGDSNYVHAIGDEDLREGKFFEIEPYKIAVLIKQYHRNANARAPVPGIPTQLISNSGIGSIQKAKLADQAERNIPGLIFELYDKSKKNQENPKPIVLYGAEQDPLRLVIDGKLLNLQLRRKHYPLDFGITLLDFRRKLHPGTQIPAEYESDVLFHSGESERKIKIWMNHPLRSGLYTLFQASFAQPPDGPEESTFAVVVNPGRHLPYISSLTIFFGMLLHFLIRLGVFLKKRRTSNAV